MSLQLKLDFGRPRIMAGKRSQRLTVTCSDEFREVVDLVCKMTDETISELGFRYFLDGIRGDLGRLFMAEPHLDQTLTELIRKKF